VIGDDIAAALPELQAHAESMMRTPCAIKRSDGTTVNGDGETVTTYVDVWSGMCQIPRALNASEEVAGSETVVTTDRAVKLPVAAGHIFLPNDVIFVDDVARFRVIEDLEATWEKSIRLQAERVR
jgi:hypothetical protein